MDLVRRRVVAVPSRRVVVDSTQVVHPFLFFVLKRGLPYIGLYNRSNQETSRW